MIEITLLGTAALAPIPDRALTAAVLTVSGRSILFDCGEGTQTAARRAGISLMKADLIALTHYHGDHTLGLPGLMQTMNCMGRTAPLTLTGPQGLREALEPIMRLAGRTGYEVRLMDFPPEGIGLADLDRAWPEGARLTAFATEHRCPSQGYRFELSRPGKFQPERAMALGVPQRLWGQLQRGEPVELEGGTVFPGQVLGPPRKGLCFVFSGDTAFCESLMKGAAGADLLIAEGTYGEDAQAELAREHGHMTFAQVGEIAARAGVRRLWLAHYSQMIEDPLVHLPSARAFFPEAECGEDGKRIVLRYEDC